MEEWKIIEDFTSYSVSTKGRVKNNSRNKILKPQPSWDGYLEIRLYDGNGGNKKIRIHRLVAKAFLGPGKPSQLVCHKDDDSFNNKLENLKWGTQHSNIIHAFDVGRKIHTGGPTRITTRT